MITQSLMRLGRELRYRPLPIIGARVVIETLDDVEHVLRQLVAPWITRDSRWDGCETALGLAKYGLLDRWCNVEVRELDGALTGIAALRANGFAPDEPDPDPDARTFVDGCLADLAASIGPCTLKLFLEDRLPHGLRTSPELLPDYFPRPFIVSDACITNAPLIWLGKHFYL